MWDLRVPRALLAFVVGAGLAVGGAVIQAAVRNPLGDPYLLGIVPGASSGAVARHRPRLELGGRALAGRRRVRRRDARLRPDVHAESPRRQVAADAAHPRRRRRRLLLLGDHVLPGGEERTPTSSPACCSGCWAACRTRAGPISRSQPLSSPPRRLWLRCQGRRLNALVGGRGDRGVAGHQRQPLPVRADDAHVADDRSRRGRRRGIGFIGLMVPHLVRLLVGADHRRVLIASALLGGVFLAAADIAARKAGRRRSELPDRHHHRCSRRAVLPVAPCAAQRPGPKRADAGLMPQSASSTSSGVRILSEGVLWHAAAGTIVGLVGPNGIGQVDPAAHRLPGAAPVRRGRQRRRRRRWRMTARHAAQRTAALDPGEPDRLRLHRQRNRGPRTGAPQGTLAARRRQRRADHQHLARPCRRKRSSPSVASARSPAVRSRRS